MTDKQLTPAQRGYAPEVDHLGYAKENIGAEERRGTSVPVVTFAAYRKSDGAEVVLDDRTFDAALHSLDPVKASP